MEFSGENFDIAELGSDDTSAWRRFPEAAKALGVDIIPADPDRGDPSAPDALDELYGESNIDPTQKFEVPDDLRGW